MYLASSQTSRIPGAKRVYASFYSRESLEFLAPVCDCLWHPRRLQGFPMPNEFTLVSTSRESPEYIAPVCHCLWHPRRLPGSPVPNDLRLLSTSRDPPVYIATVCYCLWHPRRLPGFQVPNEFTIVSILGSLLSSLHRSATVFGTLADFQDPRCQTT